MTPLEVIAKPPVLQLPHLFRFFRQFYTLVLRNFFLQAAPIFAIIYSFAGHFNFKYE